MRVENHGAVAPNDRVRAPARTLALRDAERFRIGVRALEIQPATHRPLEQCEPAVTAGDLHEMRDGVVVEFKQRRDRASTASWRSWGRGEVSVTWYCMPIARWSLSDVWAYIASRGLRYHRAYDVLTERGVERQGQRVAGALGERGSGFGRHSKLRLVDPRLWSRLVTEFPHIGLG